LPQPIIQFLWFLLSSLGYFDSDISTNLFAAVVSKPIKPAVLFEHLRRIFAHDNPTADLKPSPFMGIDTALSDQTLKILLAEDNPINQKVTLIMLSKLGYAADLAENGLEVVEAVDKKDYDIILMDVQMPLMDGKDATRAIRAKLLIPRQPYIIALTASAMEGYREKFLEAGMNDYLPKPIRLNVLEDALNRWKYKTTPNTDFVFPEIPIIEKEDTILSDHTLDAKTLGNLKLSMGLNSTEIVIDLIHTFLHDTPGLINNLNNAYVNLDYPTLQKIGHTLKSTSALIGAKKLSEYCRILEDKLFSLQETGQLISPESTENLHQQVEDIITEHSKACKSLNLYIEFLRT